MSGPGFLSPQVSRRRGHPSHHMHVHRLVWPEAIVGELSSPSREETQTHEGQVETVPHVEERLVQTGRSRNHLGKQTGRVGGRSTLLSAELLGPMGHRLSHFSTHLWSSLFPHLLPARHPEWLHFGRSHVKSNQPGAETLIREWLASPRNSSRPPCPQPQERPHPVLALR